MKFKEELFRDFDPTSLAQLKDILKALDKPKNYKQYGQNFLMDSGVRDDIIEAAALTKEDEVLEIGPGSGILTQKLVEKARRVVALDIDPYLLEVARVASKSAKNLDLRLEDVRNIHLPKLFCGVSKESDVKEPGQYVVVSNLPYYLTGFLLQLLTSSACNPKRMVVTVQKEVADRILAEAGDHTMLSISLALYGKSRLVRHVSRRAFWPQPQVDSGVVRIDRHKEPIVAADQQKDFFRVVKAGFSSRRKKLGNSLAGGLQKDLLETKEVLESANIDPNRRAQELTIKEWALLSQLFNIF